MAQDTVKAHLGTMEISRGITPLKDFAQVMTTDSDLWVVPRYEELHLINILALQRQLSTLELRIEAAVKNERVPNTTQEGSPSWIVPEEILQDLQRTLKAYNDAILSFAAVKSTQGPAPHVFNSLQKEGRTLVVPNLRELLDTPRDRKRSHRTNDTSHLLSISTGPRSWFHRYIEKHDRLGRLFQEVETDGNNSLRKFSENSVKNVEFAIVAACLCLVQLLPVMALTLVRSKDAKLAIIIVLIVLVSLMNCLFANTMQATNFGAVAAYSAIVVAFVSQNND